MFKESKDQRLLEIKFVSYRNHTNRMDSVYKTHRIEQDTHRIVVEAFLTVQETYRIVQTITGLRNMQENVQLV